MNAFIDPRKPASIEAGAPRDASRAYETLYTAALIDSDLTTSVNAIFRTASARRDAVVEGLLTMFDDVTDEEVDAVLAPFGGACADEALQKVLALFADAGHEVDLVLGEHLLDVGPAHYYTATTVYGDGSVAADHYPSAEARLAGLRERIDGVFDDIDAYELSWTGERGCLELLEEFLSRTGGRVYLTDADRVAEGEEYHAQASSAYDTTTTTAPKEG